MVTPKKRVRPSRRVWDDSPDSVYASLVAGASRPCGAWAGFSASALELCRARRRRPFWSLRGSNGQSSEISWVFAWVDRAFVEDGQRILPIEMQGEGSEEFAALHLILNDLEFASDCLEQAAKIAPIPDVSNTTCKALVFAGVVSYARAFHTTVRDFKLSPKLFEGIWSTDSCEIHTYLFELRQRHIAHSVNDFERCETVGVIVTTPEHIRQKGVSGIGVTMLDTLGLNGTKLDQACFHIQATSSYVRERIEKLRIKLHDQLRARLDGGGEWKIAPLMKSVPDLNQVAKRRNYSSPR